MFFVKKGSYEFQMLLMFFVSFQKQPAGLETVRAFYTFSLIFMSEVIAKTCVFH